ncbi:MAG: ABC transporter substrate-binding protein [Actinomycetota bacterium]|nr:ABC transporter substrate-binding protein [Actinomycetota bacterium]
MKKRLALLAAVALLAPLGARAAGSIVICGHVSITGAAPVAHNPERFGQVYFNYVDAELGGINGRPVEMDVFDDGDYPSGALAAVDKCQRFGDANLYVGESRPDQIASVASWAEQNHVPYLHSSMPANGTSYRWSAWLSPTSELRQTMLADLIADNATEFAGGAPAIGMVVYNSPYYQSDVDTFRAELDARGLSLAHVYVVEKDERSFEPTDAEIAANGDNIVNLDIDANSAILMAEQSQQTPLGAGPQYVSAVDDLGTAVVAQAMSTYGDGKLITLHDPDPVYDPADTSSPWYADEQEFLRIFHAYSSEQNPPPDDADWKFYLIAKRLHRFLLAANGDYSSDHLQSLFSTFTETSVDAFPACALDFSTTPQMGQHALHAFKLDHSKFVEVGFCASSAPQIDIAPPSINCGDALQVSPVLRCTLTDGASGVGAWSVTGTLGPIRSGDGGCSNIVPIEIDLRPGADQVTVSASDCAAHRSSISVTVVSVPA